MRAVLMMMMLLVVGGIVGADNLIPNAGFGLNAGGRPEGWLVPTEPKNRHVWSVKDGVLKLVESAAAYTSSVTVTVPVDGFKSYRLSGEVRSENLTKSAAVYYYWETAEGKVLTKARFAISLKGTADWKKFSAVLPIDDPAQTGRIRICLAIYHQEGGSGFAEFRNLSLEAASDSAKEAPAKAAAAPVAPKAPALDYGAHHFTFRNPGEPYYVERGGVGFLDLSSRVGFHQAFTIKLSPAELVESELYLLPYGKRFAEAQPSPAPGTFSVGRGIDHTAWGNVLYFRPKADAPEEFVLTVEMFDGSRRIAGESVRVRQIAPAPAVGEMPRNFRLLSWYGYPLERCDWAKDSGVLNKALFADWERCGFRGARAPIPGAPDWATYVDFTHILPFWGKDAPEMPRVRNAGGGAGDLICPSALIRGGADYYAGEIERRKRSAGIAQPGVRVVTDYEPYSGRAGWVTAGCFCADCRRDFASGAGLDRVPEAREILTGHENAWIKFRCAQRAAVIKAMADAVHRINPDARFALCSMPMPGEDEEARYLKEYGIDLRLHDPNVDVHMPMNYTPGIDFFKRLERDAVSLRKPRVPVFDNGWGTLTGYYPERSRLQLLGAAFTGIHELYFGRGLMLMDGKMRRTIKETLAEIARLEPLLADAPPYEKGAAHMRIELGGENDLYLLSRKLSGGREAFLIVNNHPAQGAFVTVSVPSGDSAARTVTDPAGTVLSPDGKRTQWSREELARGIPLELPPFGSKLYVVAPSPATAAKLENAALATQSLQQERERRSAMLKPQKRYGMTSSMAGSHFQVSTPAQTLLIDPARCASARWTLAAGTPVAREIARDGMTAPAPAMFTDTPAHFVSATLLPDRAEAKFVLRPRNYAYDGLAIFKTYLISRDKPEITVNISVVPEKGYRPFRYRVTHIPAFDLNAAPAPYSNSIGCRIPTPTGTRDITPENNHLVFSRNNNAFFAEYGKPIPFSGNFMELYHTRTGSTLRGEFDNAAELFSWRRGNDATMEWIYPDAYPDNDPHKVKIWNTTYTLKFSPKNHPTP